MKKDGLWLSFRGPHIEKTWNCLIYFSLLYLICSICYLCYLTEMDRLLRIECVRVVIVNIVVFALGFVCSILCV